MIIIALDLDIRTNTHGGFRMIVMDLNVDNFFAFRNFHINFSYPKKIVNSNIENESLIGLPNFRYKKVNIIMGSNATGKTSLGKMILSIFVLMYKINLDVVTNCIADKKSDASFSLDFVNKENDKYRLYRIDANFDPSDDGEYTTDNTKIQIDSVEIKSRENYETCSRRLDALMKNKIRNDYIHELEKVKGLSWLFSFPLDSIEPHYNIMEDDEYLSVLEYTLKVLDPAINRVSAIDGVDNAFAIHIHNDFAIIKDGKILNGDILSSGTKAGIDIADIIASIKTGKHRFYYCDEKFSYVHSDIEKGFLSLMISLLRDDNQLFFTTHNLDILDMSLPKHSFYFLRKRIYDDGQVISVVNAADYLKKNTDSLRNAVDNDLFSIAPNLECLDEIENL